MLLKGTHGGVDGVYTADPRLDPTATKLDEVSFMDVVNQDLRAMDLTAITFCKDNKLADPRLRRDDARQHRVAPFSVSR